MIILVEDYCPHSRAGRGELLCTEVTSGQTLASWSKLKVSEEPNEMEYTERQPRAGQAPDLSGNCQGRGVATECQGQCSQLLQLAGV